MSMYGAAKPTQATSKMRHCTSYVFVGMKLDGYNAADRKLTCIKREP